MYQPCFLINVDILLDFVFMYSNYIFSKLIRVYIQITKKPSGFFTL